MSEVVQLYKDKEKQIKAYPKTLASEVYMSDGVTSVESSLEHKANLNSVFNMANMGQDIKEAMTGGSVAIVGIGAVLNENIVDKAVDESKVEFLTTDKFIKLLESDITGKGFLKPDGTIDTNLGFDITNYIQVEPNTSYNVNCHRNTVFYDANKVKIDYFLTSTTVTNALTEFKTPTNCKYIRTNLLVDTVPLSLYRIKKLNYTAKLNGVVKVDNENFISGLRFLEPNMNFLTALANNVFNKTLSSVGKFIQNDGSLIDNVNYSTSSLILGNTNMSYSIPIHRRVVFYNSLNQVVRYTENANAPNEIYTFKMQTGEVGFRVAIPYLYGFNNDNFYVNEVGNYQLNQNIKINSSNLGTNSKWKNKRWMQIGDSITFQDSQPYASWVGHETQIARGYQTVVNELVGGFATSINKGQGGTPMTNNSNYSGVAIATRQDYTQYDLVTFAHGTNDFRLDMPLGTLGKVSDTAFVDTTFYGAYRKAVEYALTSNPNLKLVLITPLKRNNSGYTTESINTVGCKLIDYVNAIREIGEMYGLPVLDMYKNGEFNKLTLGTFTYDGLHPVDEGYIVYGKKLFNLIEYVI